MATVMKWSGAGLANGAFGTGSVGTGDTAPSAVTGSANLALVTSSLRSPCIGVTDGTGLSYATWTLGDLNNFAFRFYFRRTANSTAIICQANDTTDNKLAGFDFTTTNFLRLSTRASGTNVNSWVGSVVIPADGTWMRGEYKEDAAGNWSVAYYTADGTTPVETGSGTKTHQALRSLNVGRFSGAVATTGLQVDDIAVGDTAVFLGPAVTAVDTAVYALSINHLVNSAAIADRTYTVDASASAGASASLTQTGGTPVGTITQSPSKVFNFADPGGSDDLVFTLACGTASRTITIPRSGGSKPATISFFGGTVGNISNWG